MQYLIAFHSRPEVGSDVISGEVVDPASLKVRVKYGDSRSNRSRDIRTTPTTTTTPADGPYDNRAKLNLIYIKKLIIGA